MNTPINIRVHDVKDPKKYLVVGAASDDVQVDQKAVRQWNEARCKETGRVLKVGNHVLSTGCPVCMRDFESKKSSSAAGTDVFPVQCCPDWRHVVCIQCELKLQSIRGGRMNVIKGC